MNIAEAKEEIKKTVAIYIEKDELGDHCIPFMKQRPVFMTGAPGIGKTAIVEQAAAELGIGFVSYSMTHHTRQSAIGLPYIEDRGTDLSRVTKYTMSEIIASVYDVMSDTGSENGILFLDEINCVSETLYPAILQFLQYKTFGGHRLPEGWVIVTAGNLPQYNRAVREFDIAVTDRLKVIHVEEDHDTWMRYARDHGVHSLITAFLEINKKWSYSVRMTPDGYVFATSRGWEDLSFAIKMYEKKGFKVDLALVEQYISDPEIASAFYYFYDMFRCYRTDYQVQQILEGTSSAGVCERAGNAPFDERIAVTGIMYDMLSAEFADALERHAALERAAESLRSAGEHISEVSDPKEFYRRYIIEETEKRKKEYRDRQSAKSIDREQARICRLSMEELLKYESPSADMDPAALFSKWNERFDKSSDALSAQMKAAGAHLENAFSFIEKAWGEGQELTYWMTLLTCGRYSSAFIAANGSDRYLAHNDALLIYDTRERLEREIQQP